jgi:uncharacterized protein (TIRG00374 family)
MSTHEQIARPAFAGQEATAGKRSGLRKLALIVVSFAISLACGYIAVRHISLDEMRTSLSEANYLWLIPALLLTLLTAWLRALRWRAIFVDPERVTVGQSLAASSIGLMFNNILPSRGGELMRVLALRRVTGLSAFEIGTTILVERVLDVFVLGLAGVALWAWLPSETWINVLGLVCFGAVAFCVVLTAALAIFRGRLHALLGRLLAKLPRVSADRATGVRQAVAAGVAIARRPRRIATCVGLTAATWFVAGLAGLALFPAFDLDPGTLGPWLVLIANSFALVVPSSPGTVGVYEASVQASLVAYGISPSAALSYALVLHALNFFPVILMGLAASWWLSRQERHHRLTGRR